VPIYPYDDQEGKPSFRVKRFGNKNFAHEHPANGNGTWEKGRGDAPLVPYHLPEVLAAIDKGQPIYVCEGEKDADTAMMQGVVGTTNSGGAGKWRKEHSFWLRGAEPVIVIWDRDEQGQAHALQVSSSLRQEGISDIRFRRAAEGKDLTDHIKAGYTLDDLVKEKPRPQARVEDVEVESEHPEKDLPLGFRLVKTLLKGLVPEVGKFEQYNAICPAHDDHSASLSVRLDPSTNNTLLTCHANCTFKEITAALGLTAQDLMGDGAQESDHDAEVAARVKKLHVYEDAKHQFETERSRNVMRFEKEDDHTGVEELLIPDESEQWLIDSWIPADSLILLNAERKTGKTVLCLALAKAICDEEPFLGMYSTSIEETGMRVLYLNYEMTASMFRRWLRNAEFKHPENFLVKHLKGYSLPFHDEYTRDQLAAYCARMQVGVIIFDTQIKAMTHVGVDENSNTDVTFFHNQVEILMEMSGVRVCLFAHHLGKSDKEKGRGASRIEDGVDVILTLTKEDGGGGDELDVKAAPRSLRGEGRDVEAQAIELEYNPDTRMYTSKGISARKQAYVDKYEAFVQRLEEFKAREGRWPNTTEVKEQRLTGVGERSRREFLEEAEALKYAVPRRLKVASGKPPVIWRPTKPKSTQ
jgi:archaellum biogenesis ATPase FlaH